MRTRDRSSRILLVGVLLSAALHSGLMLGFVRWSAALGASSRHNAPIPPPKDRTPPVTRKPESPAIRLGLERSQAATLTWIGFERATEHQAEQSTTEQSAFTTALPAPAAAVPPPQPEAQPQTAPRPDPRQTQHQLAENLKTLTEQLAQAGRALEQRLNGLAEAMPMPPTTAATPPAQAAASAPPASPAAPAPQPTATSEAAGAPGSLADKESVATSVKKSPTVRPGQVLAGQGLEIQTRAPRWSYTTMLTRRPKNPTVQITFGSDGAVRQAEFVRDGTVTYGTGYDDVDQPLLNAIYSWTARGRALRELKPGDPGVSVMITIILSG